MSTTSSTTTSVSTSLNVNSVAATSSSSNPSSSSASGPSLTLTSAVPLTQNLLTAIHLKQISESTTLVGFPNEANTVAANLMKLTSPITASAMQPIANIINAQPSGIVKSKIMVCVAFYLLIIKA